MVKSLNKEDKRRIVEAIREAENKTSGEIRVHVKARCSQDVLKDAQKTFNRLGMQKTKERNGVLILVAWQSRQFAFVGDAGIHEKVGDAFWNGARDVMADYFSKNDLVGGIVAGVTRAGDKLKIHFSAKTHDKNELPDRVSEDP